MKNNQWKPSAALFIFSVLLMGYALTATQSVAPAQSQETRRLAAFD
jgi:hypothetical protein